MQPQRGFEAGLRLPPETKAHTRLVYRCDERVYHLDRANDVRIERV
jgi:hypothetical protein